MDAAANVNGEAGEGRFKVKCSYLFVLQVALDRKDWKLKKKGLPAAPLFELSAWKRNVTLTPY